MRQLTRSESIASRLDADPRHRRSVLVVFRLDRAPDPDRLRESLWRAACAWLPLRSFLTPAPCDLTPPSLIPDARFLPENSLHSIGPPADGRYQSALQQVASGLVEDFPPQSPLWEGKSIANLKGGETLFVLRLHPLVAENLGWLDELLDTERNPACEILPSLDQAAPMNWAQQLAWGLAQETRHAGARAIRRLRNLPFAIGNPRAALERLLAESEATAGRLFTTPSPPATRPEDPPFLASFTEPWSDLEECARVARCDVLDIVRAAAARALATKESERITATVEDPDNRWLPLSIPIPVNEPNERTLLAGLHRDVQTAEQGAGRDLLPDVADVLDRLPPLLFETAMERRVMASDLRCDRLAGLPVPAFFAGARVDGLRTFAAGRGHRVAISLTRSLDEAALGLSVDTHSCRDPECIVESVHENFRELLNIAG